MGPSEALGKWIGWAGHWFKPLHDPVIEFEIVFHEAILVTDHLLASFLKSLTLYNGRIVRCCVGSPIETSPA